MEMIISFWDDIRTLLLRSLDKKFGKTHGFKQNTNN